MPVDRQGSQPREASHFRCDLDARVVRISRSLPFSMVAETPRGFSSMGIGIGIPSRLISFSSNLEKPPIFDGNRNAKRVVNGDRLISFSVHRPNS